MADFKYKINVTGDKIYGEQKEGLSLYMIVWQRLANTGIIYCWAINELDALKLYGYSPKFVEHTVVKINPKSMPCVSGVQG